MLSMGTFSELKVILPQCDLCACGRCWTIAKVPPKLTHICNPTLSALANVDRELTAAQSTILFDIITDGNPTGGV